jgi:predicted nucleic acid-binding Zn ribbon protein
MTAIQHHESACSGDCADPMAAPRGILNALALSVPIWVLIALAWWLS